MPRSNMNATVANQNNHQKEKYFYKFDFSEICPRLRKDSIRSRKVGAGGAYSLSCGPSRACEPMTYILVSIACHPGRSTSVLS